MGITGVIYDNLFFDVWSQPLYGYSCGENALLASPAPEAYIAIDLGADSVMGGELSINTCDGHESGGIDTLLFVGLGLPCNNASWQCVASNDDSDDCTPNNLQRGDAGPVQSAVTLSPFSSRFFYIIVTARSLEPDPNTLSYTLTWSYTAPVAADLSSVM